MIDVNGLTHELTEHHVSLMIIIGWLTFIAAWLMNGLYYKTHPCAVDFSPKRFRDKMFIYIFGKNAVSVVVKVMDMSWILFLIFTIASYSQVTREKKWV